MSALRPRLRGRSRRWRRERNLAVRIRSKAERDYAPLAAVGGIAVLGLMLLVGVLIGKGNSTTASAPAPIVRVGRGRRLDDGERRLRQVGRSVSKKASAGGSAKAGAKQAKGGQPAAPPASGSATIQASTQDLESLSSQSGDSYEQQSKKLPDEIATPGTAAADRQFEAARRRQRSETVIK